MIHNYPNRDNKVTTSLIFRGILVIAIIFGFLPIANGQLTNDTATINSQKIRIQSYPGNAAAFITWWVARDKGFCQSNGLTCEFVPLPSAPLGIQALVSNDIQIASGPTEVAIGAAARGADIQLIASTNPNLYFSLSVSNEIPLPNLSKGYPSIMQDLKGKKIGVTARGAATEMQVTALLQGAGLTANDVTFVAVGAPGTAYAAFAAKQIDAAMMFEPFKTICEIQNKCITIFDPLKGNGPEELLALNGGFQYVAATRKFIKNNPRTIDAIIKTLYESVTWLKDPKNFEQVVEVLGNNYQISKDIADPARTLRNLAHAEIAGAGVTLDRAAIQATVDYMLKFNALKTPFDSKNLVYERAPSPNK